MKYYPLTTLLNYIITIFSQKKILKLKIKRFTDAHFYIFLKIIIITPWNNPEQPGATRGVPVIHLTRVGLG